MYLSVIHHHPDLMGNIGWGTSKVVLKVLLKNFLWAWFRAGFIATFALNTHGESRASGPCSIQVSYAIKLEEVLRISERSRCRELYSAV
jgi:hypothetical protein